MDWDENLPQALVITPTRELAIQIKEDFFHIGRFKRLKVSALFGKSPFYIQEKELKQKTHVVVGTPGRIFDHLDRGTFDPSKIKYLVIDEADEMLRMGFVEQVERILEVLPKDRVTIVLSATMPSDISALCTHYMNNPMDVVIEEQDPVAGRIVQTRFEVSENQLRADSEKSVRRIVRLKKGLKYGWNEKKCGQNRFDCYDRTKTRPTER